MIKYVLPIVFLLLLNVGCQKDVHDARLTGQSDAASSSQYSTPYVQVLDAKTKAPISECSISLVGWGHVVETNSEGCFGAAIHDFPGQLASRARRLRLWHPDYDCRLIRDYMPDQNGKITVFMQKGGSASLVVDTSLAMQGQIRDIPRVRVLSVDKRTEIRRMERSEDQIYRFSGIKPGSYTIEVYFWDTHPTRFEPAVLRESETTTVEVGPLLESGKMSIQ